jgi:hypothetical protein
MSDRTRPAPFPVRLLAACALAAAPAAQAQVVFAPYVAANASVSSCFSGSTPTGCVAQNSDTGFLLLSSFGGAPASAQASLAVSDVRSSPVPVATLSGQASAFFEARPGILRSLTQAGSVMAGTSGFGPSVQSRAGVNGAAMTNPGASFLDTLTLDGGPAGLQVPVTVTVVFEGRTSRIVDAGHTATTTVASGAMQVTSTAGGARFITHNAALGSDLPFIYTESFQTLVTVGTPFQLAASLESRSESSRATFTGRSETVFDATSTGSVFLEAPAGYTLVSASGHNYAPIPEPPQAWLLLAGLLALVFRRHATRR